MPNFFHIDDLARQRRESGKLYFEFLRVPAMSAGVYVLPKGGTDPQKPHREDEMYYVVRGRARMQIGDDHAEVRAGSIIFAEAELEHRVYDITEELEVLVFFAPAEQERIYCCGLIVERRCFAFAKETRQVASLRLILVARLCRYPIDFFF